MGYSDFDGAGDPMTRRNTSCTFCFVGQVLLTSECKGRGTVSLSSGDSVFFALGALSDYHTLYTQEQTAARHEQWQRNREQAKV